MLLLMLWLGCWSLWRFGCGAAPSTKPAANDMASKVQPQPKLDALRLLRDRGYPVRIVVDVQVDRAILWLNLDDEPNTTFLLGGNAGYEPVSITRSGFIAQCPDP